jgi:hypothetical protein
VSLDKIARQIAIPAEHVVFRMATCTLGTLHAGDSEKVIQITDPTALTEVVIYAMFWMRA